MFSRDSCSVLKILLCFACLTAVMGALGAGYASAAENVFSFRVVDTREISGFFSTKGDREIRVDWGDGASETFSGRRQTYSKDYGKDVRLDVNIYAGDEASLTEFAMTQAGAEIRFNLEDLPESLTYLRVSGDNTVTGGLKHLPAAMTYFSVTGRNTISGDLADLPEGLTFFGCHGSEEIPAIQGDLIYPRKPAGCG